MNKHIIIIVKAEIYKPNLFISLKSPMGNVSKNKIMQNMTKAG